MDTTDPNIIFDQTGVCNYCNNFEKNIAPYWRIINNKNSLSKIIKKIKSLSEGKEYDCIIGVSGGVDSSYLLHLAVKEFNLRPLVYHVDTGWNSQVAVENIEKILDKLNLELHTEVIYWPEMRDLQLSFFKSNVPHLDTPQDHAIFASLYNYCNTNKIKTILNGGNFSTECIREPLEWHYHASDAYHLKHIHSLFGEKELSRFPISDIFTYKIYYKYFKKINVYQLLNYLNYNKSDAINILNQEYGWNPYKYKHHESRFTRFYEGYWLLKKFGYDKRKAHFSSLILTSQMSREEALDKLKVDPISNNEIDYEIDFVSSKLNIDRKELTSFFSQENKSFRDYKSRYKLINFFTKLSQILNIEKRIIK